MSHYYRNYQNLEGSAKVEAAIADIKDFLGDERFDQLNKLLTEAICTKEIETPRHFRCLMMLSGVGGYPLQAWWEKISFDADLDLPWIPEDESVPEDLPIVKRSVSK